MRRDSLATAWSLCWAVALWGLVTAVPVVVAQEGDVEEGNAGEPQQAPPRPAMPFAGVGYAEPGDELERAKALQELVRQELELRDEQIGTVGDLFEEYLEAVAEQVKKMEATRQENAARIEELQQEAAEARENRDRQAMGEISRELREATGADGTFADLRRQLFAGMMEVLDEEQGHQFRRLVGRAMRVGDRERRGPMWEMQILRQALLKLELPREQRKATLRHFKDLKKNPREAWQEGGQDATRMVEELREAVLAELDQEQVAALEEIEAKMRQKFEARRRHHRPGKGGQPPAAAIPEAGEEYDEDEEAHAEEDDETGAD